MQASDQSQEFVRTAALPYRVPVDFVVRTFLFVLLGTVVLVAYTAFRAPESTSLATWALYALLFGYVGFLQFRPSGLTISEQGIHHTPWLRKKRSVPWDAIESVTTGTQDVYFHRGTLGKVDASQGPYLMIIVRRDAQPPFVLNIKPYTMRGIITLSHFLIARTKHARLDEQTLKLTKGIVPSLLFGDQKGRD